MFWDFWRGMAVNIEKLKTENSMSICLFFSISSGPLFLQLSPNPSLWLRRLQLYWLTVVSICLQPNKGKSNNEMTTQTTQKLSVVSCQLPQKACTISQFITEVPGCHVLFCQLNFLIISISTKVVFLRSSFLSPPKKSLFGFKLANALRVYDWTIITVMIVFLACYMCIILLYPNWWSI